MFPGVNLASFKPLKTELHDRTKHRCVRPRTCHSSLANDNVRQQPNNNDDDDDDNNNNDKKKT